MPDTQRRPMTATGIQSSHRMVQGDTQIDVNVPSLSIAQTKPIDFTGLLKLGADIVEGQQQDMTTAAFTQFTQDYSNQLSKLREQYPNMGDADVMKFNTAKRQELAIIMGKRGGDLTEINKALTAFDKIKESEDQYTIDFSNGDYATRVDKNGNVQIFSNPVHQERLRNEVLASFGPAGQSYFAELAQTDPARHNKELSQLVAVQWQTQQTTLRTAQVQAMIGSAQGNRELQQELGRDEVIAIKRDIFNRTRSEAVQFAAQVKDGTMTPERASALIMERYSQAYLNSPFTEGLISFKEDPEEMHRLTKESVSSLVNTIMEGADPNVPLQREHLAADLQWRTIENQTMLGLQPSLQRQVVTARYLSQAASMSMLVDALSETDAAVLLYSNQDSIAAFTGVLEPLRDATSTPEQWMAAANMLDNALINSTSSYNIDDKPVVRPEEIKLILDTMINNPKYNEYISQERRDRHKQLIERMYDNMAKNSGRSKREIKDALGRFIQEDIEEPGNMKRLWDWSTGLFTDEQ